MVQKFKMAALAGAFMMVAAPAFAQDMNLNNMMGTGIDLDPFHILTPAPAPAPAPAPMMMKKHHMGHHHMMMHHKKMMMHHKKKMMMHKKMMMEKKM